MALRFDEIADLIKIIDASACEELVLETAEIKLTVRRTLGGSPSPMAPSRPAPAALPESRETAALSASIAPNQTVLPPASAPAKGSTVRAPMVGVFYRAPSPDVAPFVDVGTVVKPGDPLCIIEVMKLFTTIYAESGGRIAQIGAVDAEFVEYDRVLFVMESSE